MTDISRPDPESYPAADKLPSARLAALNAALTAARVGKHAGGCTVISLHGWTGTYEISWFGRSERSTLLRVTLAFTRAPGETLCDDEVGDLLEAIELYAGQLPGLDLGRENL